MFSLVVVMMMMMWDGESLSKNKIEIILNFNGILNCEFLSNIFFKTYFKIFMVKILKLAKIIFF